MASKIAHVPSDLSSSSNHGNHNSEATFDANHEEPSMASEPIQNITMHVAVESLPTEGDGINYFAAPRFAIKINTPGWIALMFCILSRLIQVITGAHVGVRLFRLGSSSRESTGIPPNHEHIQPSMAAEPLPNITLPNTYAVGLRAIEGDHVTYINAHKLMTTTRVAIVIDAPRWIALRFFYIAGFIRAATGAPVHIRYEWIDGLGPINLSGDLIADTGSPA